MKVAFWNGISMSDDVVNYMAAIGIILAREYNCEVILCSSYISNHMLQDCFSGKFKKEGSNHTKYRFLYGSLEYCRALWSMKRTTPGKVLEIPMEGVTIIFPPEVAEKRMFYHTVSNTTVYMLDMAEESRSVLQNVIEEADIMVIFLPQDVDEIQKFLNQFSKIIPDSIVVIEEHQRTTRPYYRKIIEEYGIKTIGYIPKNKEFKYACEEGNLDSFLRKKPPTKNPQYCFFSGIRKIAKLIYERNICKKVKESEEN